MATRQDGRGVGSNALGAFIVVTSLFFAWGFITSLIDPLVAAVKGIFSLNNVEAQLSASAFFIAYGVMSFPAALLLSRKKAVSTILIALAMMIAGCLLMLLAANIAEYSLVLLGLFVLASGITILQVAANPLAAALGRPEYSHFRLTFSQAFNSFGTVLGPLIGAGLFLKGIENDAGTAVSAEARAGSLLGIDFAFFWVAGLIALIMLLIWLTRRVVAAAAPATGLGAGGIKGAVGEAIASRWTVVGGAAIFLYVGAEVAIGTQMAFFLSSDAIWGRSDAVFSVPILGWAMASDGVTGVSLQEAAKAVAFYWGGALIGRLVGSLLLIVVPARTLLAAFTATTAAMCLYVAFVGGVSAGFVALAIGLFNSIMFPLIFTLTLERSTASAEATSGFLCFSIVGGAAIPPLVGFISDQTNYIIAFVVPAACYALLFLFAVAAGRARLAKREGEASAATIH